MFVRPKNVERETWEGFRYGVDGAKQEFGFDAVYSIDDFEKEAPKLSARLPERSTIASIAMPNLTKNLVAILTSVKSASPTRWPRISDSGRRLRLDG